MQVLDLLFHSDVIMMDSPHGEDFYEKRKSVAFDLAQTLASRPANLKICIDYIIAASRDDEEIITLLRQILSNKRMSVDLPETSRVRVYHTLINYKMLPRQIAEEYAMSIGEKESSPAEALQWSIRSNDLRQLESQVVGKALAISENFQELRGNTEKFNGVHFQKHTLNTKIVENVLKYNNTKRRTALIDLLSSTSSELTLPVKLDILKELYNLLYENDSKPDTTDVLDITEPRELPKGSRLSKAECLTLMRVTERLQRQEQMAYNDLFVKFKSQLMASYATALTAS